MNNQPQKKLIFGLALFFTIGIFLVAYAAISSSGESALTIDILPDDSTVQVDSKIVKKPTNIRLNQGPHTIFVHRDGFKDQTETIILERSKPKSISVYLDPINSVGLQWIKDHPTQALKYEGRSGALYNAQASRLTSLEPLVRKLPFIAGGFEFRIDYGTPKTNTDKPTIFIRSDTQQGKSDALIWIKNQGFDPATLTIVYPPPVTQDKGE